METCGYTARLDSLALITFWLRGSVDSDLVAPVLLCELNKGFAVTKERCNNGPCHSRTVMLQFMVGIGTIKSQIEH